MKYKNEKTLAALCLASSQKYKNLPALAMFSNGKISRKYTYQQMGKRAQEIGFLLRQLGAVKGSRVLLLSENCPEWALFYFGIALAGSVSVPLLTGFSGEQIQNIARHAEISAVCLSRSFADRFEQTAFSKIPFIYIDSITDNENGSEITASVNGSETQIQLRKSEEDTLLQNNPDINAGGEDENALATIIYTSGTQGNSKGVMLSGKNIISSAIFTLGYINLNTRDRMLSVLPLAHSYECCLGFLAPMIGGSFITYLDRPPSPSVLLPAVKIVRPTVMAAVPLLIEKIYNNGIAPKLTNSRLYKFPLTRPLAVRVAGRKLISALGGSIRYVGIGGSPLSPEVEKFLRGARFPYAIGYGLTETAPLTAGSKALKFPIRCVGTPPKGVKIRIVKHASIKEPGVGEIQIKGPHVMLGYYNDAERTAEAFTQDGWLRTGDLGRAGKKNRLFISGRLKALILGPSGENIYPEEIESLLGTSSLIEDALVYLGKKGELIAMVNLTEAAKAAAGKIENTLEDLRSWVNKKLASFSRLSKIEILHEPFEKTPTMKIKRYLYGKPC